MYVLFDYCDYNTCLIPKEGHLGLTWCEYFSFIFPNSHSYSFELYIQTRDGTLYTQPDQELDSKNVEVYLNFTFSTELVAKEFKMYARTSRLVIDDSYRFSVKFKNMDIDNTFKIKFKDIVEREEKEKVLVAIFDAYERFNESSLADRTLEMGIIHNITKHTGSDRKGQSMSISFDFGSSRDGHEYILRAIEATDVAIEEIMVV